MGMGSETKHLNIKVFPDDILRRVSSPVEKFNDELKDIFHEMLELMRYCGGIGLAGPQVGIASRLFVCELNAQVLCLANPQITVGTGESSMVEGCLSLPGVEVELKRKEQILVKGFDAEGREKKFRMAGMWARLIQHEYDHLNGILITDRAETTGGENTKTT